MKTNHSTLSVVRTKMFQITGNKRGRGLYFAYGSNLCLSQMLGYRCPKARPLFKANLHNWKLVFRGCADVERCDGQSVSGGVFEITRECEAALDRYEGFPLLYTKATTKLMLANGKAQTMMFYVMTCQDYESAPNQSYFNTILKGYADFQMSDAEFDTLLATAERADQRELDFRRSNPHLIRNNRGRYEIRPFIQARDFQSDAVSPYSDRNLDEFMTEFGVEPYNFDARLSDLIGTFDE